jgi:hypothetical protein
MFVIHNGNEKDTVRTIQIYTIQNQNSCQPVPIRRRVCTHHAPTRAVLLRSKIRYRGRSSIQRTHISCVVRVKAYTGITYIDMKFSISLLLIFTLFFVPTFADDADEDDIGDHPKMYFALNATRGIEGRFICVLKDREGLNVTESVQQLILAINDADLTRGSVYTDSLKGFVVDISTSFNVSSVDEATRIEWKKLIRAKFIGWLENSEVDWIEQVSRFGAWETKKDSSMWLTCFTRLFL